MCALLYIVSTHAFYGKCTYIPKERKDMSKASACLTHLEGHQPPRERRLRRLVSRVQAMATMAGADVC